MSRTNDIARSIIEVTLWYKYNFEFTLPSVGNGWMELH